MERTLHLENLPRTIELERDGDGRARLVYIDQRRLPDELVFERTGDWRAVVDAVKALAVRGAPALGIAGAAAVALWAGNAGTARAVARGCAGAGEFFLEELEPVAAETADARPTAVNLAWGVRRAVALARDLVASGAAPGEAADALYDEVKRMEAEDEAVNRAIGDRGAELIAPGSRILTHCNAGSLGTAFFGTALGIVYAAAAQGKVERVFADETRPVGQGARLTAWELSRAGVPCTLICDDMAASLMAAGGVDAVLVGADRIAANGDVANKIGTYGVAVLARHHGIPFYVAAPTSTIDLSLACGEQIPIEERDPREVLPRPIAGVDVWNPAFDVTPAALVDRIVTEKGAFAPGELEQALSSVRA
ncbi:S-methyl-5-thioribose-1-phosphate isomerase [Gordonibacter massiliensis (ex Traore et al. 2017)]|uniref:S-methyl-5-thioribose-1-phosphate isomerase n=1 Tax=Gordonibacter massiliensis (ex Traore et al. 2017) TaxID=1841863 RepID=UPI0009AF4B98|nr:S-methyl-5-thioribose-1-phosphate isomerase [Gordonibacter massiliensis (ex Traore et al. 2017)]MBX9033214.1 S-methyl-5-thioribose-1-phosphate isomerase [Gordonibacter massiliensis (ex Traore et al. 2017)]